MKVVERMERLGGRGHELPGLGQLLAEERAREHLEAQLGHVVVDVPDLAVSEGIQQPRAPLLHQPPIELQLPGMKGRLDRSALADPEIPVRGEETLSEREPGRAQSGGLDEATLVADQDLLDQPGPGERLSPPHRALSASGTGRATPSPGGSRRSQMRPVALSALSTQ